VDRQSEAASNLTGQQVLLSGHFAEPVVVEAVRPLGSGFELRVRRADGQLEETVLSESEFRSISATRGAPAAQSAPANPDHLRLLVESARIRLAYAYDRQFAVSLSGIRTLPHQIEAVYLKMLPQPRLRFLLADDPGAGKTIMAGLLLKEMKLREAIERVLIIVPAPLTIQWQDELLHFFGETFQIIAASNDQQQLINPWQRESQVITSLDYAKQEDVRERIWQQRWDLVIIDEAHKCSAYTKRATGRSPEAEKTKRYQLAEHLTAEPDRHVLFLTATPHHGDDDRFGHFLRLLDPDLFPEPHRLGDQAQAIRRDILRLGPECPWALRRLKEDLRDMNGRRLFPDRHVQSVSFQLSFEEFALYKAVTAYINQFLPQAGGRQKQNIALTRTVLQRRLASSTNAIHESLKRRLEKQRTLMEELEALPANQRGRHLDRIRGRLTDDELDEDDLDDAARDRLTDEFTAAVELDQLRAEVAALKDLVEQARRVREHATDSKLSALSKTLQQAQFAELQAERPHLRDGRGKLLIFTEHRDTLSYLQEQLEKWGYSTVTIHGGMNPHERKRAQDEFHYNKQVCIATEAAGEGINLQFCHLMINYDLPWNPTRLEQRLGRIHRIGQDRDVYAFNFVADKSVDGQPVIEGSILKRLLDKLDLMRDALGKNRVFDVIGEVLSINEVNLSEMLREAAYDPRRLDEYLDQIDRIDPDKLRRYEEASGIALAREHIDVEWFNQFQSRNFEIEERRLMPEYVARQFLSAADLVGMRVETRADGFYRVEHVPQDLRSERLEAVQRLGKPEVSYRKVTFQKQALEADQGRDALLLGPGHPLYAAVDEKLNAHLANVRGATGVFVDADASSPYRIHFIEMEIRGDASPGARTSASAQYSGSRSSPTLHAELVAVREENGQYSLLPADVLHDLAPHPSPPAGIPGLDVQAALDFVKATYQLDQRLHIQAERQHYAKVVRDYLGKSFEARIRASENRVMMLKAREAAGESNIALALQQAKADLDDLKRTRAERMAGLERLTIARSGTVRHLATALVLPPGDVESLKAPWVEDETVKREIELAAMRVVMEYERARGWEPFDVSDLHDRCGFDIRSLGPADPATGQRPVRRIEVKGRLRGQPVRLTTNEWLKARQLAESYYLYVVWDPKGSGAKPSIVQDPGHTLEHVAREIRAVSGYELPADAVASFSQIEGR
jgi:superfamily II DNA or RNA helicase